MKYYTALPFSALLALCLIWLLVDSGLIPPGIEMLELLQGQFKDYFYALILLIILLESIVYVGFYFPGQFFAVVLVVLSAPTYVDILNLTLAMVIAASLGSCINFALGAKFGQVHSRARKLSVKRLLMAMIHINSLAFFMFYQGANKQSPRIILLAGLLNLPYYLLLIFSTAVLSEEVMQVAENTWLVMSIVTFWLLIAGYFDLRKWRANKGRGPVSTSQ